MEKSKGGNLCAFLFNIIEWRLCLISLAFTSFAQPDLLSADYYASPQGTRSGDGSASKPWSLQTALQQPSRVRPGDTIWLRGGVYRKSSRPTKFYSALSGAPGQPITVRQFPGERAVIDGNITQVVGGWVQYWGFEIMNSIPHRLTWENGPFPEAFWLVDGPGTVTDFAVSGFDLRTSNVKLINLVIHDSVGGGVGVSSSASNAEIYGVLSFYNGWQGGDRGHGHGIYAQSVNPSVLRIEDCLLFANYSLGLHASGTGSVVDNFRVEGNVSFFNSILSRKHQGNILIGPSSGTAKDITLIRNFVYQTMPSASDCNLGYVGGIVNGWVERNYFATRVLFSDKNQNVKVQDNVFLASPQEQALQTNQVEVRVNKYEPERAHIIVYNWQRLNRLPVDLANVLSSGTHYEIRNGQDVLGPPVMRGVYDGGLVHLPMTNLFVAKSRAAEAPKSTAPEFNVFLLLPDESALRGPNTSPVVSGISNQSIYKNGITPPAEVNIRDAETPAELLNLSVHSSDTTLVPHRNIQFGGTDSVRTIIVTPEKDRVGKCTISLAVSDGSMATIRSFVVNVMPSP